MATTPELLLPADGMIARLQSLVFNWGPVDAGGPYVLEISTDEAFTDIVQQAETELTQVEVAFDAGNVYYWRVRAGAELSPTARSFTAPALNPAPVTSHIEDGLASVLTQFREEA